MAELISAALLTWILTPAPARSAGAFLHNQPGTGIWTAEFSLANRFDGNINHDVTPIRSYGVVPGLAVAYESPQLAAGYESALNNYSGTDEWDRVSHGGYLTVNGRVGERIRFGTGAAATWRGSSDDRELANEFGISQRIVYSVREGLRLGVTGAWRFKEYPDDPGTSGPSPFLSAKVDQRLSNGRKITLGYKYQVRQSRAVRDRYVRSVFNLEFATPVASRADRLSLELQHRPQRYQRLIEVEGRRVFRRDRRFVAAASYARPLNDYMSVVWECGLETRASNDPDKRFVAPTAGMLMTWHWTGHGIRQSGSQQ